MGRSETGHGRLQENKTALVLGGTGRRVAQRLTGHRFERAHAQLREDTQIMIAERVEFLR